MHYALLVPYQAIRTISAEQYDRLKKSGHKARGNQYKRTIITDYATYQAEQAEAIEFTHAEHHKNYPQLACFYATCQQ